VNATRTERQLAVNDVELHVVEAGEGFPVVFAHGFPELWFSWRHQLDGLAAAGYRAIAPDQRGYGQSSRPAQVEAYDIRHLTSDLIGILDANRLDRAVFVGHDWGAIVVWNLALLHPDRAAGVVGMSVPFVPRPPAPPLQLMRAAFADRFFYIVYFQEPGVADADLGRDPARTMRRMLAGLSSDVSAGEIADAMAPDGRGFVERLPEPVGLPDWIDESELARYVTEFERTGFTGGLNWYRNLDRNWELTEELAGRRVEIPSLFVAGANDPVLAMMPPTMMDGWLSDHRGTTILDGAGHWVQQEKPTEVNAALLEFLAGLELE
jgi:pimeloyl-ACP methyl ester carboxylesterase